MTKIREVFILVLLIFTGVVYSQNSEIHSDSRLDSLLVLHEKINSIDSLVPGYRVQIFFESGNYSKDMALSTSDEFSEIYPDVRCYLSFDEPYYRIRVGDFRTIIEAKGFLNKLLGTYPSAFEVKDMIYFPLMPE